MKGDLINIGFDEQEAEVYLQLLSRKRQTANELSKSTGINRSVTYSIISRLIAKGFVNYVLVGSVKHFSATDPRFLKDFLKEKEKTLQNILPTLISLERENEDLVSIEVYQGLKGGITVMKDIIREHKDYDSIGENEAFELMPKTIIEQYLRDLNETGIKERLLVKEGDKPLKAKNSQVKYLPKDLKFPTVTTIYGDKIAIAIFEKPYYIILIKSKLLAKSYKSFFESLWNIAKR